MTNYEDFKKFIKDNNVVGFASAMIIALATKDLISSIISNIVVPGINMFLLTLQIKALTKFLPGKESSKSKIDLIPFINSLLTFVLTVIITFLFILYTFQILLGIK
jgi:large-conductance mechanosensitive channel